MISFYTGDDPPELELDFIDPETSRSITVYGAFSDGDSWEMFVYTVSGQYSWWSQGGVEVDPPDYWTYIN